MSTQTRIDRIGHGIKDYAMNIKKKTTPTMTISFYIIFRLLIYSSYNENQLAITVKSLDQTTMEENQTCQRKDMLFTPTALTNYRILHFAYAALCALIILTNTLVLFAFYKLSYYRTNHHKFLITLTITGL